MRAILRWGREHPRWALFLATLVLAGALWGAREIRESRARSRLQGALQAWLDAHPPEPALGRMVGENAADDLLAAMARVSPMGGAPTWGALMTAETVGPNVEILVMQNSEVLSRFEKALTRPRFGPTDLPPGSADIHDLVQLAGLRARVLEQKGDRVGAVRSWLLVHRLSRLVGYGRPHPFSLHSPEVTWTAGPLLALVERPGLEAEGLRAILDEALRPEESRRLQIAAWDQSILPSFAAHCLDVLRPGAEERARKRGWRPPTPAERIGAALGKGRIVGAVMDFPLPTELEEAWSAVLECRDRVPLRGRGAFAALAPPGESPDNRDFPEALRWSFRNQIRSPFSEEGWLAVLRAAAAARLHEVERGALPARIEDLVPGILAEVPADPFSDGSVRWALGPDSAVIECTGIPEDNPGWGLPRPMGRGVRPKATLRPAAAPK